MTLTNRNQHDEDRGRSTAEAEAQHHGSFRAVLNCVWMAVIAFRSVARGCHPWPDSRASKNCREMSLTELMGRRSFMGITGASRFVLTRFQLEWRHPIWFRCVASNARKSLNAENQARVTVLSRVSKDFV
jgi:hypothetical protein